MLALGRAEAKKSLSDKHAATIRLAKVLGEALSSADILGRKRVIAQAQAVAKKHPDFKPRYRFAAQPSFVDIVTDMYLQHHAPLLALEIDQKLTGRVAKAFAAGRDTANSVLRDIGGWTRAYADTVYRTNLNAAFAAGRFMATQDPEVRVIVPAKEYMAVGDSDTRENHDAADGLIAGVDDPVWETFSPPMGFNCRCSLRDVDRWELQDKKLLSADGTVTRKNPPKWSKAHPDPGFGRGRPDRRFYLGR